MNADDFEERLRNQPLREVPVDWRSQILSAAEKATGSTKCHPVGSVFTSTTTLRAQVVSLLWPSPKIWAGLAVIWLLLAVANQATFNPTKLSADSVARPAAVTIAAWKEQQRILAELMQPGATPREASSPTKPGPRSELAGLPRMS